MPFIVGGAYAKAFLTRKDPRHFLFFPRTAAGKYAAAAYFERLAERTSDRDEPISSQARLAQLREITTGGLHAADDLEQIKIPVLVANGDHDLMVASAHSPTWLAVFLTPSWSSTPTPDTVACSSTTASSCPRSSRSWRTEGPERQRLRVSQGAGRPSGRQPAGGSQEVFFPMKANVPEERHGSTGRPWGALTT